MPDRVTAFSVLPPWASMLISGLGTLLLTCVVGIGSLYSDLVFKDDLADLAPYPKDKAAVWLSIRTNTEMQQSILKSIELLNEKIILDFRKTREKIHKNETDIAVINSQNRGTKREER